MYRGSLTFRVSFTSGGSENACLKGSTSLWTETPTFFLVSLVSFFLPCWMDILALTTSKLHNGSKESHTKTKITLIAQSALFGSSVFVIVLGFFPFFR